MHIIVIVVVMADPLLIICAEPSQMCWMKLKNRITMREGSEQHLLNS